MENSSKGSNKIEEVIKKETFSPPRTNLETVIPNIKCEPHLLSSDKSEFIHGGADLYTFTCSSGENKYCHDDDENTASETEEFDVNNMDSFLIEFLDEDVEDEEAQEEYGFKDFNESVLDVDTNSTNCIEKSDKLVASELLPSKQKTSIIEENWTRFNRQKQDLYKLYLKRSCPFCDIDFESLQTWTLHVRNVHNYENEEQFDNYYTYTNDDMAECKYCCAVLHRKLNKLKLHLTSEHSPLANLFKCTLCSWKISKYKTFISHIEDQHSDVVGAALTSLSEKSVCSKSPISKVDASTLREQSEHMQKQHSEKLTEIGVTILTSVIQDSKEQRNNDKLFVCPCCGCEFEEARLWSVHLRKVHNFSDIQSLNIKTIPMAENNVKYVCSICNKEFVSMNKRNFQLHAFRHLPYDPYKCKFCSAALKVPKCFCRLQAEDNGKDNAALTISNEGLIMCECCTCGRKFDTLSKLTKHLCEDPPSSQSQEQSQNYAWFCTICHLKYTSRTEIQQHVRNKHRNRNSIIFCCPICGDMEFEKQAEWKKHIGKEHQLDTIKGQNMQCENNQCVCLSCGYKLRKHTRSLLEHAMLHYPFSAYKCRKCGLRYTSRENARIHLTKCKINKERKLQKPNESKKFVSVEPYLKYINYACPECNIPLENKQLWRSHIESEHWLFEDNGFHDIVPGEAAFVWECDVCSVMVRGSPSHAIRHKLTHTPYNAFICTICRHRSRTQYVLINHMRRQHFSPGSFKCNFCPLVCQTFYECYTHVKAQHSDVEWPDNVCRICLKALRDSMALGRHMIVHDTDRTIYSCGYCNRRYCDLRDRKKHWILVHPKEYAANDKETSAAWKRQKKAKSALRRERVSSKSAACESPKKAKSALKRKRVSSKIESDDDDDDDSDYTPQNKLTVARKRPNTRTAAAAQNIEYSIKKELNDWNNIPATVANDDNDKLNDCDEFVELKCEVQSEDEFECI